MNFEPETNASEKYTPVNPRRKPSRYNFSSNPDRINGVYQTPIPSKRKSEYSLSDQLPKKTTTTGLFQTPSRDSCKSNANQLFLNTQSTPAGNSCLDLSIRSFIPDQSTIGLEEEKFELDPSQIQILDEVAEIFRESTDLNTRRKSILETELSLHNLQKRFFQEVEDNPLSWFEQVEAEQQSVSGVETTVGEKTDLFESVDTQLLFNSSESGTIHPSQEIVEMAGVQIDPNQFKALFDECFHSAISSPSCVNSLKSAVSQDIDKLKGELADLKLRYGSIESKVSSVSDYATETAYLHDVKNKLPILENTLTLVARQIAGINQLNEDKQDEYSLKFEALDEKVSKFMNSSETEFAKLQENKVVSVPPADLEKNPVVQALSDKINLLESTGNLKLLLFDGIPETDNENVPEKLVSTLYDKLVPGIRLAEIESARRVGNQRPGNKPRPILCEFVFASIACRTYQNRMQLAKANRGIFISEFLSKQVAHLFYVARSNRGPNKKLSKCWTFRGQVYVAKSKDARGSLIRNLTELNVYLNSHNDADEPQAGPSNVLQTGDQPMII